MTFAKNAEARMDIQVNPRSIAAGDLPAAEALRRALEAADAPAAAHVFVRRFDARARVAAQAVDAARAAGLPLPPLAGLPVSIKDLFDVTGEPTTAASKAMSDAAPATADGAVVARLRAAGAVLIGHTNLSEFAFSGVGINPHHGTPRNPCSPAGQALVPGGSTSGGAVSVALGAAWAALGSDTGGSIRIPAALQGLVGFKNTQRLTPLQGSVPLSTTLDTACAITRNVADAILVHGVLAGRAPALSPRPMAALRLGVPQARMLADLDPVVARAFDRCLQHLSAAGATIETLPLGPLDELDGLQSQANFAAAESWAWHRQRLTRREADYDPRVAVRIRRGATMLAADYIELLHARRAWIARMEANLHGFDAMLSPTVPVTAPALAPLLDDDARFFETNALLLRNPSAVNFLDGCALSMPCHAADELPVGLMLWGPALSDDTLLGAALAIEARLRTAPWTARP